VGRYRVKVWLDDVRDAPPGWVRTFTPEEVIGLLRLGEVTELSLDHDLGLMDGERELTGYDVVLWLEKEVGAGSWRFALPEISIHSANPVGHGRMRRAIESIRRMHEAESRSV
jgi:hypothetical protein